MTIEKLEALERAAAEKYDLTEWSDEHLYEINGAVMNALPKLLAVAKAAKAYVDQWPNASTAHANLVFAVAQLEATP